LLAAYAGLPDDVPACLEIGHTIIEQMGFIANPCAALRSAWVIVGKHRAGGVLLALRADMTKDNGDLFAVSYDGGADEYTVTYAKFIQGLPDNQPDEAVIIEEKGAMHCDDLCRVFTDWTGIEIPVVAFG
jgi:hypothetical protein